MLIVARNFIQVVNLSRPPHRSSPPANTLGNSLLINRFSSWINHRRVALRQLATEFHQQSRSSAGARALSVALRIQSVAACRFLAIRLMKEARLFRSQCHKHRYSRGDGENAIVSNELDRQLTVSLAN